MDLKLELVLIPVTDVDRAKDFYVSKLGFHLDVDHQPNDQFRVVQMTPPGSACSITIGKGVTQTTPGSYKGTHLVVTDIEAAREELRGRGVEVSEVRHMGPNGWQPGPEPERSDYNSFADFRDPDGNTWILQERGYAKAGD
ncbi:MAG TPA: VOC family protein [Actinomycetota bacterium]|nr:VOC family protein [Actinomycetota bacterium]